MQSRLNAISLQAIKKSPRMLTQYWKSKIDRTKIILGGRILSLNLVI